MRAPSSHLYWQNVCIALLQLELVSVHNNNIIAKLYWPDDLPDGGLGHLLQEVLLVNPPLHHCSWMYELPAVWLIAIVLCIGNGLLPRRLDVMSHCGHAIDLQPQALLRCRGFEKHL